MIYYIKYTKKLKTLVYRGSYNSNEGNGTIKILLSVFSQSGLELNGIICSFILYW